MFVPAQNVDDETGAVIATVWARLLKNDKKQTAIKHGIFDLLLNKLTPTA